ncbi:MAG: putative metal-dependent hydrolase [Bacteroidetes bacterium]|nr:putative metal-dependent hydrolase [Bacteroidota bacterium]MCB0846178.1 putative metal-dependent hydrolase [Bacteroidota bacterium]
MENSQLEKLKYPIGRFNRIDILTPDQRKTMIQTIASFPQNVKNAVEGLNENQLDTPYRPEGWTVRQLVHHVVDSHLNSYIRFKWTLTENEPLIKTYDQAAWAELPEAKTAPVEVSLMMLESLHRRWVMMLNYMSDSDFQAKLRHPEWGLISLDTMLGLYEWHCRHHLAHITSLKERLNW